MSEPSKEAVLEAIALLEQRKDVLSASPNMPIEFCSVSPNDPRFSEQWALKTTRVNQAWDITQGSSDITVGVIDSGVSLSGHEDLDDKIDVELSKSFGTEASPLEDGALRVAGHGTGVAGIIAANLNNKGIAGIADVRIASLRINDLNSLGDAIEYANQIALPILNLSLGRSDVDEAVIGAINQYNGLVIAAAGNDNANEKVRFPASLSATMNNVISVGSSKISTTEGLTFEHKSSFSNSIGNVDIYAPGEKILSTSRVWYNGAFNMNPNYFYEFEGTSFAAPHVTGAAALLLSARRDLTPAQMKQYLVAGASMIPYGNETFPRLDVYTSLLYATTPLQGIEVRTTNGSDTVAKGGSIELVVTNPINGIYCKHLVVFVSGSFYF